MFALRHLIEALATILDMAPDDLHVGDHRPGPPVLGQPRPV